MYGHLRTHNIEFSLGEHHTYIAQGASAQLIEYYNAGRGLKSFSEEGLETCHKQIRRYRELLVRSLLKQTLEMVLFVSFPSQTTTLFHKENELGAKLLKGFR